MANFIVELFLGKYADLFALIGGVVATYLALKGSIGFLHSLRTFAISAMPDFKKYGAWAVVTGATDGIGKAYANQLAKQGLNIVLVSRSPDKLADGAKEIESNHGVQTKIIAVDFSKGIESGIYNTIKEGIQGLDIGVLVNNVGMGYVYPEVFNDIPDSEQMISKMIHCNMTSLTMMTRLILPQMEQKKKGIVINISSASAARPTPMLTIYAATKAYVDFFSRGLQAEYSSKGIIVQCVMPYFVATKMSGIRRSSFFVPDPNTYVASALATVGKESVTFGCKAHAIQEYVISFIPSAVRSYVTMMMLKGAKFRYLRKNAKKE
ncbi:very-long-chain 3-oxoacyl-CoA reductase-like [Lineus longissimus]|uniref:very-long-chain 3-oxoacyl-CoA reductase-like n=1 Tax=Lineus longissimus TaxID=88925 RepID=UPI002B4C70D0